MKNYHRREFLKYLSLTPVIISCSKKTAKSPRPNILLLMSDNHSWNHLGCYGDPVVKTPNIDRMAAQGVRFTNAFCAAPSCSPARAGMLTGQDIWRLEEGADLWGVLPSKFPVYTDFMEKSGYFVGCQGKGWGPGSVEDSGRRKNHGGIKYESFKAFLEANTANRPWCFWLSSRDPHRPYIVGSGEASGMDKNKVAVPSYLPDCDQVRGDICDYYFEIQRFDDDVEKILDELRAIRQYDNTLIVICSDNGWQMPRGLANLYDFGTRVPLIIVWPERIPGARVVEDFVNLNDIAPTFLEIAGMEIPEDMTARSLTDILFSDKSGRIEKQRDYVVTARERHALCRKDGLGYPGRAIRTYDYLYIINYQPDRWPAGDPPLFGDVDAHMLQYPAPTKMYMLANKKDPLVKPLFERAFEKRPAEELYDLRNDPEQLDNVANEPEYREIKKGLSNKLIEYLENSRDPRHRGEKIIWDSVKYYQERDFTPKPSAEAIERLGLQKEYRYF